MDTNTSVIFEVKHPPTKTQVMRENNDMQTMVGMAREGIAAGNELVQELLKMKQENGHKMSQYRLAKALDISEQCVYRWVKGETSPMLENFNKLQEYMAFLKLINYRRPFQR